jgi:hypothetical protein
MHPIVNNLFVTAGIQHRQIINFYNTIQGGRTSQISVRFRKNG